MSVRADEMRWQEERIRAKKTSRGCTSAREFRVIRQYRFVRGRFAGISPARRCTFRHLAATAVCPNAHNAGVEGSSPSLSTNSISVLAMGP